MPSLDAFYVSPDDPRLIAGTPAEQQEKRREYRRQQEARGIISNIEREVPRSDLIFGPRWVELESTGELFHPWGGDVMFAPKGVAYYIDETGFPRMLEPADPPSRAEIEKRKAAREQRRLEREAAAKEQRTLALREATQR